MNRKLRIGIIGDYNPAMHSHSATDDTLRHAAAALDVSLESAWFPTESLASRDSAATLALYNALWCAPGSPYRSMAGALAAIRFAREEGWPFIGT